MTPAARQRALDHLRAAHRCSERRACGLVGLARLVARYRSRRRDDAQLRARLRELAGRHWRFGYLRLHALLRREGLVINRKRTYRLYQAEDLAVRRRCRRRSPERERRRLVVSEGATSAGRGISRATPCGPAGARSGAALVLRTEQLTPPWT